MEAAVVAVVIVIQSFLVLLLLLLLYKMSHSLAERMKLNFLLVAVFCDKCSRILHVLQAGMSLI